MGLRRAPDAAALLIDPLETVDEPWHSSIRWSSNPAF